MPKPSLTADITTTAEVALKPTLLRKLRAALETYRELVTEGKTAAEKTKRAKESVEIMFADAGETEALESGVRVTTKYGDVPMKIVKGKTARRLNVTKVIKKFKLTPKQLEDCYDEPKDKTPYLGIWLPGAQEDDDD